MICMCESRYTLLLSLLLLRICVVSAQTATLGQNSIQIKGPTGGAAILTVISSTGSSKIFEITDTQVFVLGNLEVSGGMKVVGGASVTKGGLDVGGGGVAVFAVGVSVTTGPVTVTGGVGADTMSVMNNGAFFPDLGTVYDGGIRVLTQISITGSLVLTNTPVVIAPNVCPNNNFFCLLGNIPSDKRFKSDIMPVHNHEALRQIMATRPVSYTWREDAPFGLGEDRRTQVGFIAQELQEALDHEGASVVHRTPSPSGGEIMTVDYGRLTALLAGAIQAQQELIDSLKDSA